MKKVLASAVAVLCGAALSMAADREQMNIGKLYLNGTEVTATAAQLNAAGTGAIPLTANKVLIGNASAVASAQTLSGLFSVSTGGVATATTTAGAVTSVSGALDPVSVSGSVTLTQATNTLICLDGSSNIITNTIVYVTGVSVSVPGVVTNAVVTMTLGTNTFVRP